MNLKKLFVFVVLVGLTLGSLVVQADQEADSEICNYSILLFDVYIVKHGYITVPRFDDWIKIYAEKVNLNQEKNELILENPRFKIYSRRGLDVRELIGPVTFACKGIVEFSLEPPFSLEELEWGLQNQTTWQMIIIFAHTDKDKRDVEHTKWVKFYGRDETGKWALKETSK